MTEELPDFGYDMQHVLLSYMLGDPDAFTQCQNILKDVYFDDRLRKSVRYISDYTNDYKALPPLLTLKAATGVVFDEVHIAKQHRDWFLDSIEKFCRHKALELAVLEGADLVMKGRGAELEKRVRDALSISLIQDIGTDYFADPKGRIERSLQEEETYSTGWKDLDEKTFGGFVKGGLNIFAAGSGVGKSLWLQNLAVNWALEGKHVVYISLELSEDLISKRFDAMIAGCGTREIVKDIDTVALKIKRAGQKSGGSIQIKRLPESTTTVNHIRAYLKEYEIKTGRRPDAIVIDYLDIMAPVQKVDMSNLSVKDKYVSEEVRALMTEYKVIGATASQLNRGSIEANEFDQSHIAGGLTKIQTSDFSFAILATPQMKDQGRMQLQFLKTRSSSGVGQRIEFRYDPITMRILDAARDEEEQERTSTGSLRDEFRQKTEERTRVVSEATSPATEEAKVKAGRDIFSLMQSMRKNGSP